MTANRHFYSRFFRKQSFLNFSPESLYVQSDYLASKGFDRTLDFTGKTVLELGAGAGRLTAAFAQLGILQRAKKYIVVEPSDGIERIKSLIRHANVEYLNCSLAELPNNIESASVDYFIAADVLPHVDMPLDQIIALIARFIKPDGQLHVVSSYYGFERRYARKLKALCGDRTALIAFAAGLTTALQLIMCRAGTRMRSRYVRNFIYSFQASPRRIYLQHREFYSVEPYSIFWDYRDYQAALGRSGFNIARVFPHSLALLAGRLGKAAFPGEIPAGAMVGVFGQDWLTEWVYRELPFKEKKIIVSTEAARDCYAVVLAYDYFGRGLPYYETAARFGNAGFELGRNLFCYQMLL